MTFEKLINIAILSLIIGIILTICLLLRERFAANFESLFKESLNIKFDNRYAILFAFFRQSFIYLRIWIKIYYYSSILQQDF